MSGFFFEDFFSFFRDAYCNISLQTEITSKDPSRVKFDHGVPFFLVHCFSLHSCGPWLQRCGVSYTGEVGALYASAATLPQAASPLQAGNKLLNFGSPMQVERGHLENPRNHDEPCCTGCVVNKCFQFRFRNLLRLFTSTSFRKVQKHIPMPVATGAVQMSIQPHVQIPASLGHANIAIAISIQLAYMKT